MNGPDIHLMVRFAPEESMRLTDVSRLARALREETERFLKAQNAETKYGVVVDLIGPLRMSLTSYIPEDY